MPSVIELEPTYVTFDCYGTPTAFGMSAVTPELLGDRVPADPLSEAVLAGAFWFEHRTTSEVHERGLRQPRGRTEHAVRRPPRGLRSLRPRV